MACHGVFSCGRTVGWRITSFVIVWAVAHECMCGCPVCGDDRVRGVALAALARQTRRESFSRPH